MVLGLVWQIQFFFPNRSKRSVKRLLLGESGRRLDQRRVVPAGGLSQPRLSVGQGPRPRFPPREDGRIGLDFRFFVSLLKSNKRTRLLEIWEARKERHRQALYQRQPEQDDNNSVKPNTLAIFELNQVTKKGPRSLLHAPRPTH